MKIPLKPISLLVTIVLTLLITIGFLSTPLQASTAEVSVSDISISNVRERYFTVSWVTNTVTIGEVHYGISPDNLDQIELDTRGASTSDDTHFVTLGPLTENTTYYFDIHSNGDLDDNNGEHYSVTTGPELSLPGSDTVYGQVFKSDGVSAAEGCIVIITLQDNDGAGSSGQAAPLSSLTDQDGNWYVNLAASRVTDLSDYFEYSAPVEPGDPVDNVHLSARCASDGYASQTVDTGDDSQAPDMVLAPPLKLYLPFAVRGN